ncbi:unnamed protein product [Ilex paraguariensis]|uniref:Uncharacterized protein n=1 Tax=Ilex paraguariensis TaxID=185542 RepID=A0ABC8RH65_9AQUA
MNHEVLASQYSSGCESGWTLYLEHSFLYQQPSHRANGKDHLVIEEKRPKYKDEEEDLSMVSDASSGPPHHHDDEDDVNDDKRCFYHPPIDATLPKNIARKKKKKESRRRKFQEQQSFLDDTASSTLFNFSKTNQASMESLDFSQGYSTTHFEGRSAFQGHVGFFQSSLSGNQLQQNHSWFQRRWG